MKKYKFLLKPLLFIFNLLFASWLVLEIEKIKPSQINSHPQINPIFSHLYNKQHIKKLCFDYSAGIIDSVTLDKQLEIILKGSEKNSMKN